MIHLPSIYIHPSAHMHLPVYTGDTRKTKCGQYADNPAEHYCPKGSGYPLIAGVGNYTTPDRNYTTPDGNYSTPDVEERTGQSHCPPEHYCEHGLRKPCPPNTYTPDLAENKRWERCS